MKLFPIIVLVLVFLSGGSIGLLIGQKTAPGKAQNGHCVPASHDEIDTFYTTTLGVTKEQKLLLAPIEEAYLKQKQIYIEQMAAANNQLAQIIEQKGYEDEDVADVVMSIHRPMGALQHLTLQHLAQIKTVLTTEQAEVLQNHVVERLRHNP